MTEVSNYCVFCVWKWWTSKVTRFCINYTVALLTQHLFVIIQYLYGV